MVVYSSQSPYVNNQEGLGGGARAFFWQAFSEVTSCRDWQYPAALLQPGSNAQVAVETVEIFFCCITALNVKLPQVSRLLIWWWMRRSGADVPTTACTGTTVGGVYSIRDAAKLVCVPTHMRACTFGPLAAPTAGRASGWSLLTQPQEQPDAKLWPSCHLI